MQILPLDWLVSVDHFLVLPYMILMVAEMLSVVAQLVCVRQGLLLLLSIIVLVLTEIGPVRVSMEDHLLLLVWHMKNLVETEI